MSSHDVDHSEGTVCIAPDCIESIHVLRRTMDMFDDEVTIMVYKHVDASRRTSVLVPLRMTVASFVHDGVELDVAINSSEWYIDQLYASMGVNVTVQNKDASVSDDDYDYDHALRTVATLATEIIEAYERATVFSNTHTAPVSAAFEKQESQHTMTGGRRVEPPALRTAAVCASV